MSDETGLLETQSEGGVFSPSVEDTVYDIQSATKTRQKNSIEE